MAASHCKPTPVAFGCKAHSLALGLSKQAHSGRHAVRLSPLWWHFARYFHSGGFFEFASHSDGTKVIVSPLWWRLAISSPPQWHSIVVSPHRWQSINASPPRVKYLIHVESSPASCGHDKHFMGAFSIASPLQWHLVTASPLTWHLLT